MKLEPCVWEMKPSKPFMEIKIYSVKQISGPDKFSIKQFSNCLNKNLEWEYQPIPSSRDDAFIDRCRFNSFSDAEKALNLYLHLK